VKGCLAIQPWREGTVSLLLVPSGRDTMGPSAARAADGPRKGFNPP
jgi:hypothetical protein